MLRQFLSLTEEPHSYDATDALAVAVCHHFQTNSILSNTGKKLKGWEEFIKKNPERVTGIRLIR